MSGNDGIKIEIKYDSHLPVLRLTRVKQKDWNRTAQRHFNVAWLYVIIAYHCVEFSHFFIDMKKLTCLTILPLIDQKETRSHYYILIFEFTIIY